MPFSIKSDIQTLHNRQIGLIDNVDNVEKNFEDLKLKYDYDVIVVGGGIAGITAIIKLSKEIPNKKIALFTDADKLTDLKFYQTLMFNPNNLPEDALSPTDRQVLIEQFNDLFLETVKDCLLSDVPLGVFLSGGIDSSAVASTMSKAQNYRRLKAFTIGFEDKSYDELDKAKMVASHNNIKHLWEIMPLEDVSFIKKIVENSDEPFADTSMIPMYVLSSLSRKNATVCLSGV